jgi:hypothetical protein
MLNTYRGRLQDGECVVSVDGRELPLRLDLRNHSPTGFAWGYGGSGPAQLALAILSHHCRGDEERAIRQYQNFKWRVIGRLAQEESWSMTSEDIEAHLQQIETERPRPAASD